MKRDAAIEKRMFEALSSDEYQTWKKAKDELYVQSASPDISVKSRRQIRWRQWVVNSIYALAEMFEPQLTPALALLSMNPALEVSILFDLIARFRVENFARFTREHRAGFVLGDQAPPEFPEPPSAPRIIGGHDSFCVLQSRKGNRSPPNEFLPLNGFPKVDLYNG